jgi:hypothetical protein
VTPNKNTSGAIVLGVSLAFIVAYYFSNPSWPAWAQVVLAAATVSAFPLLNSLGILKPLGLDAMLGSRFNFRRILIGVGFMGGAFLWLIVLVRLMPNPSAAGAIAVLLPTVLFLATALFFFIKGTIWR